jgi:hypothetical protein
MPPPISQRPWRAAAKAFEGLDLDDLAEGPEVGRCWFTLSNLR